MSVTAISPLSAIVGPLASIDADLLVIPWFEGDTAEIDADVDRAVGGELTRALVSKEFQGKKYELFLTPTSDRAWRARRVAFIGGGKRAESGSDIIRKLASAAGISARQKRIARVAFAI